MNRWTRPAGGSPRLPRPLLAAPSQASILTGLYPATHGMRSQESRLPGEAVTLAEALAERGYTTAVLNQRV